MRRWTVSICLLAGACAGTLGVRQEDLDAWPGQPVSALETHPVFLTMPLVRGRASDGTEIWNYVNGRAYGVCTGGGFAGITLDAAAYSQFSSCMAGQMACNNIFYIRGGVVQQYTPIGTGGARCYTTDAVKPGFRGPANIR